MFQWVRVGLGGVVRYDGQAAVTTPPQIEGPARTAKGSRVKKKKQKAGLPEPRFEPVALSG